MWCGPEHGSVVSPRLLYTRFSLCGSGLYATGLIFLRIICRAFQGLGAGGVFAVAIVMLYELKPPDKYSQLTSLGAGMAALGNALGPIFGGVISQGTTWRWVFLLK